MKIRVAATLTASLFLSACGGGSGDTVTTQTTAISVNQAPVIDTANSNQTAIVGTAFEYDATQAGESFSDADGDALSYVIAYSPAAQGLSDTAGVISGTPSATGTVTIAITASDGNGGSVENRFDVVVSAAGTAQTAVTAKFAGRIDLDNMENYENQTVPNYITKLETGGNPITDEGATLGRVLFYDTALSFDDSVSCSSCHMQSIGFGDSDVASRGVDGGVTGRHSMRLINTQFADEENFFWDERADSHEAQETMPLSDHNEHGFSGRDGRPDFADLVTKLEGLDYYQELFTFVYGDAEVTEGRLQLALAQFTKSIWSFDSKYDVGRAQTGDDDVNFPNFTDDENAGKDLFMGSSNNGGAGCDNCHRPPEFDIRPGSDHNGVVGVMNDPNAVDFTNTRSPSLRDVATPNGTPNGPFMHDGSLETLLDVVNHYDDIQTPIDATARQQFLNSIDNRLTTNGDVRDLDLSNAQKAQLVAFLNTLSGSQVYTDEKWSNPF